MAANDNATVTFDQVSVTTDYEWKYPLKDGITELVVNNAQTIEFDLTAASTGSSYVMSHDAAANNTVVCDIKTDGTPATAPGSSYHSSVLTISSDPQFTFFVVPTDATEAYRAGAMRVREPDGYESDWEISKITIDNVDEPTEITSATFTAKDGTNRQFFWGSVGTSHPGNTSTDAITVSQ